MDGGCYKARLARPIFACARTIRIVRKIRRPARSPAPRTRALDASADLALLAVGRLPPSRQGDYDARGHAMRLLTVRANSPPVWPSDKALYNKARPRLTYWSWSERINFHALSWTGKQTRSRRNAGSACAGRPRSRGSCAVETLAVLLGQRASLSLLPVFRRFFAHSFGVWPAFTASFSLSWCCGSSGSARSWHRPSGHRARCSPWLQGSNQANVRTTSRSARLRELCCGTATASCRRECCPS